MFAQKIESIQSEIVELTERVKYLKAQQKKISRLSRKASVLLERVEELKDSLKTENPDAIAEFKNQLERLFQISPIEPPKTETQQEIDAGTELQILSNKHQTDVSIQDEVELVEQPIKENRSNEFFEWQPTTNPAIASYFNIGSGETQATYVGANKKGVLVSLGAKLMTWLPGVSYEIRRGVRMTGYKYEMKVKGLDDDTVGWLCQLDMDKDINVKLWSRFEDCPQEALRGQSYELCCPLPDVPNSSTHENEDCLIDEAKRDEIIAATDALMGRINWSQEQGRDYIFNKYGKRSRQLLGDRELLEFWNYLKELPAKKPKRHTRATSAA